jgi:hypothetical protein
MRSLSFPRLAKSDWASPGTRDHVRRSPRADARPHPHVLLVVGHNPGLRDLANGAIAPAQHQRAEDAAPPHRPQPPHRLLIGARPDVDMAMREVLAFPFATSLRGGEIRTRDAVMLSSVGGGKPLEDGQPPEALAHPMNGKCLR